jgi:hypothetical protein
MSISTETLKLTEYYDKLVFCWLAIPWLQKEADSYMYSTNTSCQRANHHKVLPNSVLDVMFKHPESVGALDFKVSQRSDQKYCILISFL